MNKSPRPRQSGFVLSVEAILILTLLGIGLLVGVVAVRDSLFKWYMAQQDTKFIAAAAGTDPAVLIGEVIGFDQHETPLVPFIDYEPVANSTINFRALIGVRDDRFTSRQPIFYSDTQCTSNPCIAIAGSEDADTLVANLTGETGSISYLYALQGNGPTYGVGAGTGADVRGKLYRQDSGVACGAGTLQSMWVSQRVVAGSPCVDLTASGSTISGASLTFFESATEVLANGVNALERLTPPFITNTVTTPSTGFTNPPPDGE
jgi:hypothetical protein